MRKEIAVFCASHHGRNPHYEVAAKLFGTTLAQQGRTLVYGGSNLGYMGTVSSAVLDAGGYAVGIIPTLFSDEVINSQPRAELIKVSSMAERKQMMIARCDAFVALPGGIGTLDEITEVLVANQLGECCKPMALLNVDGYFNAFLQQLKRITEDDLLRPGAAQTLLVSDNVEKLLQMIDDFSPKHNREFLSRIRR